MSKRERFRFIRQQVGRWSVAAMCRALQVSQQGYYQYLRRPDRALRDRELLEEIYECLREEPENANYGVRRIICWLRQKRNYTGGSRRIYRICREHHLTIRPKRRASGTTTADSQAEKSENLIQQDFTAEKPNEKLLTDITEIPCQDGKLYLAAVLDCFDGSIQGFHVDGHMRAELCVKALEDACRKSGARGMIVHSDRGSQFTSHLFREALKRYRAIQSMSGTGRCYDNARMESFFATLKKEKLYPVNTRTLTKEEVQSILFRYISYYNLRRISLVNGGLPPLVYRQQYLERTGAA